MLKQRSKSTLTLIIIGLLALTSIIYCADPMDELKDQLIDLNKWDAEEIEESNVNVAGMKIINTYRTYSKDDRSFDATILVGSNMMIQGQTQGIDVETSDVKVVTGKIDNFNVIQSFNKDENEGYVVVTLIQGLTEGSLFMINFTGLTSDEALDIAKKYNWQKMKTISSGMIN